MTILIDLQKVTLQGADRTVLENLLLTISSGDRIGVVGINGTGKTHFLKIIAGDSSLTRAISAGDEASSVGYPGADPRCLPAGTVRSALGTGWQVDAALDRLGMLGAADTDTANLSGGQLKRVALARMFAEPNDVLILDEPTNHLDLNAIQWLEQQIVSFRGAVILVSHDRFLLDQVTTRMVEIDRGKTYVHGGGYSRLLEAQAEREEQAASAEQVRRNLARTELAWLRRGVKARVHETPGANRRRRTAPRDRPKRSRAGRNARSQRRNASSGHHGDQGPQRGLLLRTGGPILSRRQPRARTRRPRRHRGPQRCGKVDVHEPAGATRSSRRRAP